MTDWPTTIQNRILVMRENAVLLDSDLADLYGVGTGALNQAVSRNRDRFPDDFAFRLSQDEWGNLKSQNVISSSSHGGRRHPPRVFTEHGALMASTVLRSDQASAMALFIIRAFVKAREERASNQEVLKRLAEIDKNLLSHDSALRDLYQKIIPLLAPPPDPPKREIGFTVKEKTGKYSGKKRKH